MKILLFIYLNLLLFIKSDNICNIKKYNIINNDNLIKDYNFIISNNLNENCELCLSLSLYIIENINLQLKQYYINIINKCENICNENIISCYFDNECKILYNNLNDIFLDIIIDTCEKAIKYNDKKWENYYTIGNILLKTNNFEKSLEYYKTAAILSNNNFKPLFSIGNYFTKQLKQVGEYYYYLSLLSDDNINLHDLSTVYTNIGHFNTFSGNNIRATECYKEAFYHSKSLEYEFLYYDGKRSISNFKDWNNICHKIKEIVKNNINSFISPYSLLFYPLSSEDILKTAKLISSFNIVNIEEYPIDIKRFDMKYNRHRPLRIGYYTYDIHGNHPMCLLTCGLIQNHNKKIIHHIVYNYYKSNDDNSDCSNRIMNSSYEYKHINKYSDSDIVKIIKNDSLDIFVELMGHTQSNRNSITSSALAPIKVSYLGYPSTTGSLFINYIMVDKYVLPIENKNEVSEKIVYLPFTYQINNHFSKTTFCGTSIKCKNYYRKINNLPLDKFIFVSFNTLHKIDIDALRLWIAILRKVPNSILWLLETEGKSHKINLLNEFISRGVNPNRIYFAKFIDRNMHLNRIAAADLFLDNFRYGAHTTASDALWCGIPILTCEGSLFPSRVASSFLRNLKLDILIVHSQKEYYNTAVLIATNNKIHNKIIYELSKRIFNSVIFDKWLNTRSIEISYYIMYNLYTILESYKNIIINKEYSLFKDSPNLKMKIRNKLNYIKLIKSKYPQLCQNILVRLYYTLPNKTEIINELKTLK